MSRAASIDLRRDILDELEFDPQIDASKIGVAAEDGVVTLTGHARSYTEKWLAEDIAKRVQGLKAVANDIEVILPSSDLRDDTDIAHSALNALVWNARVPEDRVKVTVADGWITLQGDVEWQFQKTAAEDAVRYLRGVRGISNQIVVEPHVYAADVKEKIESALRRKAEIDAEKIAVDTSDGTVTLSGAVRSWSEHEDAIDAAWAAPGVKKVVDHISIRA
jgi:osmotically-inducible protein OsmY